MLRGELAMYRGDFAGAKKAFADLRLSTAPGARDTAVLFEGLAALRSGNNKEALTLFDDIILRKSNDESVNKAQVFKAAGLMSDNPSPARVAEAEKLLASALPKVSSSDTLCKAIGYNTLGDILKLQKKPPKETLVRSYMFVVVLYDSDPIESAKALFHAQELFAQLGQRSRAEDLAKMLVERYPTSPWAKKLPPGASTTPHVDPPVGTESPSKF
jgi:outer membrane protein assembly factor BamD (BamD/ComL family)